MMGYEKKAAKVSRSKMGLMTKAKKTDHQSGAIGKKSNRLTRGPLDPHLRAEV
jgi:hypothetical protein